MLGLLRTIFSSVLKDNPDVRKSVLTGCLRISKESLFTGLNNLSVYSITSDVYASSFGFTEDEVDDLLVAAGFQNRKKIIREWYDGYRIGSSMIFAPWDVLSYVKDLQSDVHAQPNNYWANTSSNDVIRKLIDETKASISNDYSALINGESISKTITENLTYNDLYTDENNIWSLMLETGYLTLAGKFRPNGENLLRIPNEEIKQLFISTVNKWFSDSVKEEDISPLFDAIWNKDAKKMEGYINRYLARSISYYDYSESFYHAFLTGLFYGRGYAVKSNRPHYLIQPDMITLVMTSRAENIELALGDKQNGIEEGVSSENEGVNPENEGVSSENVGVNTENVGVNTENVGVNTENVGVNTENVGVSRKERCSYIIRRMKDNPVITANDLSTILSASKRTIERDIAWLTGKQIITRTGADKNGRWIVLKEFEGDE